MVNLEWNSLRVVSNRDTMSVTKYLPEVNSIVRVVPEPAANNDVALSLALLDGDTIGVLAVVPGIAVPVRVEIGDHVVGQGTLHVEAALVVIPSHDLVEAQVAAVLDVNAVGAVGESETLEVPVLSKLDVKNAALLVGNLGTDGRGRVRQPLAVDDDYLIRGRTQGNRGLRCAVYRDVDVLEDVVCSAAEDDNVAGLGDVDGALDVTERLGRAAVRGRVASGGDIDIGRQGQGKTRNKC